MHCGISSTPHGSCRLDQQFFLKVKRQVLCPCIKKEAEKTELSDQQFLLVTNLKLAARH
jgi:hypothetical protein